MEFQMEVGPCFAFLWEMWKLLEIVSFPASYYSLKVLGFHKTLIILTETGLSWGGMDLQILGIYSEETSLAQPSCHGPDTAPVQGQQIFWVPAAHYLVQHNMFSLQSGVAESGHCSYLDFSLWRGSDEGFLAGSEPKPLGSCEALRLIVVQLAQSQRQNCQSCTLRQLCCRWKQKAGIKLRSTRTGKLSRGVKWVHSTWL